MEMKRSVLRRVPDERCTGCGACSGICPHNALRMDENSDGFFVPLGTESECRDCGLCLEVCPALRNPLETESRPDVFAAWSADERVRVASASGGAFAEIGRSFLESGGLVAGARYAGLGTVAHVLIDDVRDLPQLQGSKYVQSRAEDIYSLCLGELERGREVLFSGTPCQVRAMGLLAQARGVSKGLSSVDLVCYGVPSSLFVRKYLGWLERTRQAHLRGFLFRDNASPWDEYSVSAVFDDGSSYRGEHEDDAFYRGFEIALRPSCYDCSWNRFPRPGDLTLGDFWGIAPEFHDKRGVSLVLVNSPRGQELMERSPGLRRFPRDLEEACRENLRVDGGRLDVPVKRGAFFRALRDSAFEDVVREFL